MEELNQLPTTETEKIKVRCIRIITTRNYISDKPYYEIEYYKVGDDTCHIGYSSYDLSIVKGYLHDYFDLEECAPTEVDEYEQNNLNEELQDQRCVVIDATYDLNYEEDSLSSVTWKFNDDTTEVYTFPNKYNDICPNRDRYTNHTKDYCIGFITGWINYIETKGEN